jgi:hypothetical protein
VLLHALMYWHVEVQPVVAAAVPVTALTACIHSQHDEHAQHNCVPQQLALLLLSFCVCVLVTRWCVVWETAQEAHHGHHRVVLVRVAAAADTQPPAQPWPWRGKPLCVVRVSPECLCTRKGSAAAQQACQQRPAEVHQGGSSTPRSSAQQHAQVSRGRVWKGAAGTASQCLWRLAGCVVEQVTGCAASQAAAYYLSSVCSL